ncbi:RibD family protein [Thiohalocapsa sp. ML1]|jgi:diaminohydroxyphosphoribosylaminopyrimidine deaminase / 5-amino-6-(5-phosphoribosylamino)uracil reductase|uniref:RibD family protein n=1 Tax=Thiohalocapsa sp. ML1 TaxID=1431688 RepID=UPI0009EAED1B|nr:RibD family protein [Thiohalocapsa sp. ML1]
MSAAPDVTACAGPSRTGPAWAALLAASGRGGGVSPALLVRTADDRWQLAPDLAEPDRDLLALYLPLCADGAGAAWTVGHLGQSLDGCIATHKGDSCFVTGPDNIVHLHRMRALSDAVLVGAGTVACDDPRLTTRLVPGPSPVRVVLDPKGSLPARYRVFTDDAAPTLLCTAQTGSSACHGRAEVLRLPAGPHGLDLDALATALAERGLRRLFVEGGGVTVSRFLVAGRLSRLQLAVAPLIIGQGRPGICLPRTEHLSEALRVSPRIFRMGADMFYDLDLLTPRDDAIPRAEPTPGAGLLKRVL